MVFYRKITVMVVLLLSFGVSARGEDGKYAGAALELGLGARPLAMGEAVVAVSGDGPLFYYNPALSALLQRPQLQLMYAPTFGGVADPMAHYHHAGAVFSLPGQASLGVSWTRFSVDEIPIYPKLKSAMTADRLHQKNLRPSGEPLGTFTDTEDVYYFTFSKLWQPTLPLGWLFIDLPLQIPMGFNLKVLRQSAFGHSASGLGVDWGTLLKFNLATLFDRRALGDLGIGVSVTDISRTAILWDTKHEDRIRTAVRSGISYQQPLRRINGELTLCWTRYEKYQTLNLWGLEVQSHGLALRAGKNRDGFTAGAGVRLWRMQVDYAFVTLEMDGVHRLSCNLTF